MNGYDMAVCCFRGAAIETRQTRVLWELNNACNLACGFCHLPAHTQLGLPYVDILAILHLLQRWRIQGIMFSGGEPLLRRDSLQILQTAAQMGFEVNISTNGTITRHDIAAKLSGIVSEISISLDSADPDIHDFLRGRKGAWAHTVNGIRAFIEANHQVRVTMMICDQNYETIEDTIRFLRDLGIRTVVLLGFIPVENADSAISFSPHVRARVTYEIAAIRREFQDIKIHTKRIVPANQYEPCGAGKTILGIDADGHLLPCILLKGKLPAQPIMTYANYGWEELVGTFPKITPEVYWQLCAGETARTKSRPSSRKES